MRGWSVAESDPRVAADMTEAVPRPLRTARLRRWATLLLGPVIIILGLVGYYFATAQYVSTDNAYVRQDKVAVSAQVTGDIVEVAVHENQHVNPGDLLFRIDPEPFRIAIAQADAAIAGAQVKLVGLETDLGNTGVD